MAGLPVAPPIRALIERGRSIAVLPFVRPALKWRRLPRTYGTGATASARWFALLRLTFAVLVLVPTAAMAVYSGLIASPQYVSEARLAVRESIKQSAFDQLDDDDDSTGKKSKGGLSAMPQGKSPAASVASGLANLLGGLSSTHTQAPFLLINYVTSLDYVAKLDDGGWLRSHFTKPDIDMWSALRPNASIEKLRDYWNDHVTAALDRRSEVVLLRVSAFTPQDAQALAERLVKDGERLINDVVVQSRADAVGRAKEQLDRVQQLYTQALVRQQEWRMRQRAVDPILAAEALGTSLLRLEQERIAADREMRALERLSAPNGPTLGVLRDRLRAIDTEIASFKASMAQTGGKNTAVDALAAYEESELDVRFAETLQGIAVSGLQEAERRARAQSAFVNVFVPPSLPTSQAPPAWWQTTLFTFMMATIFWINVMLVAAVVRDHQH